ncbi:FecR protein [Rubripirellula amarantea]|uniref:FecR protein n=1 Tax=Rubripirellula amarantea TaxID=2527999 RepID=A0A5C5WY49_9BACT|nr:hypothetical protein [Rubripirellula amarantea]TWT54933.1 FecR protein [Rubripirellula amarantea]
MNSPEPYGRLNELIGRVCDDEIDPDELRELESILSNEPAALAKYVETVDLHTMLHRQQGATELSSPSLMLSPTETSTRFWPADAMAWLATAVCISLIVGTFAGMGLSRSSYSTRAKLASVTGIKSHAIATLSSAVNCRWSSRRASHFEGQRLSNDSLDLESGIAVIRFDSDVSLTVEGPARLDLLGVDRAMLHAGKVVFSGMTDLDSFTLETPLSKIQDYGTEYAVVVDSNGHAMEVHVFDGSIECRTKQPGDASTHLEAGQARRILANGDDQIIPLASDRFARKAVQSASQDQSLMYSESFDDQTESLSLNSGEIGWVAPWQDRRLGESTKSGYTLTPNSMKWNSTIESQSGNRLIISGDVALSRTLSEPIRMDADAAYYVSMLVRQLPFAEPESPRNWTFVTLRDSHGHKIAISPKGMRGPPKVIHNGSTANLSKKLTNDIAYLFVAKILAQQESEDQVFVQIYGPEDSLGTVEPLTWLFSTPPMYDDSRFDEIRIVAKDTTPIEIDSIRIGKTWSSVTAGHLQSGEPNAGSDASIARITKPRDLKVFAADPLHDDTFK